MIKLINFFFINKDYSDEAQKLLNYLDEISSGVYVPENEILSRRIEKHRSKSVPIPDASEEPFMNFLVSMGPSAAQDGNLFLPEFIPILEALCKSTANKGLILHLRCKGFLMFW